MAEAAVASEARPVSGKIALESGTGTPRGAEAKGLAKGVVDLSLITVDTVAGGEIPDGMRDSLNVSLFGVKDIAKIKEPAVKALATDLNNLISTIENNLKFGVGATTINIDAAIVATIQSNEGWKNAFNLLPPAKQAEIVKTVREMGAVSAGRRLYIERLTIAQESGDYAAAQRKFQEADSQAKQKIDERTAVDKLIVGKDKGKLTADKDAKTSELESLRSRKQSLSERKDKVEERIDELTATYREVNPKTGQVIFNKAGRDSDPDYKKYASELKKIDNQIDGVGTVDGLDAQIIKAQEAVRKAEKTLLSFDRHDALTTEIGVLNKELAAAEGDLITARTAFTNKINELMKTLNGVLPEAAKEAMNKYKGSIDNANIQIAKDKSEEAAKAGDIIKGATANIELFYLKGKYIKPEQIVSSRLKDFFKRVGVKGTDKVKLRTDFDGVLANNGRGSADVLKTDVDAAIASGKGAGLSPEQIKYFKDNPEAYNKFIEEAKETAFKAISREAVLHLNLTETDMQTLIGSDDFAKAAEQAVGDVQKIKDLKEKLAGAGLKGGTWKEIGAKLAKPALLGLILMILIFLGIKGFGGA